ncbi:unnamed protein product [Vitrella brassicaformis CCMP3155]|uniref:Uncharacterized protein n=1 Tax=Vitrella brassicaformis (strain CCMP3155) TaxID=1169540 RepID=A0A0G4G735_VITBC|nr:unnamed protein product [Vitrella brassicaformis CCMP3155]|eukprot:CEM24478.1 unnamed protein product [Vitrella brassicaformis CCMP3155]
MSSDDPKRFTRLYDQTLPPSLLESLRKHAPALADQPNYWVPHSVLTSKEEPRCIFEVVIKHLFDTVIKSSFSPLLPLYIKGAEYWCQVRGNEGMAFHVDKDETLLKESHELKTPLVSSILYLTPFDAAHPAGPTVVTAQCIDALTLTPSPPSPAESLIVWPALNRYLTFIGTGVHGVLEGQLPDGHPRVTFLVNWWEDQPLQVDRMAAGDDSAVSGGEAECGAAREEDRSLQPVRVRVPEYAIDSIESQQRRDCPAASGDEDSCPEGLVMVSSFCNIPAVKGDEGQQRDGAGERDGECVTALHVSHASYEMYPCHNHDLAFVRIDE